MWVEISLGALIGAMVGSMSSWVVTRGYVRGQIRNLVKAFRELEGESEDMWSKVESHLGRISRLRNNTRPVAAPAAPLVNPATELNSTLEQKPAEPQPDAFAGLTRTQLLLHARNRK